MYPDEKGAVQPLPFFFSAVLARCRSLRRVAGIEIRRRFLPALRDHFRWIRFTRHAPRPELFPLHIVFRLPRLSVVELPADFDALVIDLPAGFQSRVGAFHELPLARLLDLP